MATQEIEKLIVALEARTKSFEAALAKAQGTTVTRLRKMEKEAENFATRFDRKLGAIGGSLKSFGAGLVAGLGAEQLARAAATAIKSIADIGDQAKKLGLTTDEFQTLSFTAQLAGVEVDAFASAMKKLGANSSDAARGIGPFAELLKQNNVSLTDANGKMKSQVEILGIVANLYKNATSEQDKLKIAQIAGGKSMSELANLLEQGADGVSKAYGEASNSVGRFTASQIAKAQEFDDKIDTLIKKISFGLKEAFLKVATVGVESFTDIGNQIDAAAGKAGTFAKILKWISDNSMAANLKSSDGLFSLSVGGEKVFGVGGTKPIDPGARQDRAPSNPIPFATSAGGKGDLPKAPVKSTLMPEDPAVVAERKRLAAEKEAEALRKLKELEREREQARKVAERERLAFQDKWREAEFNMAEQASQRIYDQQQAMRDSMTQLAELGYSAMESLISGGAKAKDVILNLAKSLASAAVQAALLGQGPMAGLFGNSSNGGIFGQLIGGMFGGGGNAPVTSLYDGARANGGPVSSGKSYLVGERGPEIIMPRSSGVVIPNGALAGPGKSAGVSIKIVNNASSTAKATARQDQSGEIIVLIQEIAARTVDGRVPGILSSGYGIKPSRTRRGG